MTSRFQLRLAASALVLCGAAHAAPPAITVRFLPYADVRTLPGVAALEALAGLPASGRPAAWDAWVRRRAADVQARLSRGEEDSLAYLLLFGTSFTTAPRVTREFLAQTAAGGAPGSAPSPALQRAFDVRLADCLRALAAPGSDERLSWAAATMARLGYRLDTPDDGLAKAGEYMLRNLSRVLRESTELSQALASAQRAGDRDAELAQRARIFAGRGLAPDTSWPINFALSEAIQRLKDASTLAAGSVRRVAIVGPGLDFVDKDEGQDYYPPQSIQPFAVVDALLASGLAVAGQPAVTTIDISSRVNRHLSGLADPGRRPYDLQLVRDRRVDWTAAASRYWAGFGAGIGTEIAPVAPPPMAGSLDGRAIRVSPDVLRRVSAVDANIVYQRVDVEAGERFDLVIGTNILVYYDPFEQMLAAHNVARLLAPGGLFLTNTRLDDVPAFPMTRVTNSATPFSTRPGDGEYIYVYRKPR